jgi:hypothetical protein
VSETDIRSTSAHVLPPKSTGCITLDPVENNSALVYVTVGEPR